MPRYELIALFPGSVSEEEVPAQVTAVREEITKHGGSIVDESSLGRRKLAYPINKHHHGTYHVFRFDAADGHGLAELNQTLKLKPEVTRHMVLSVPIVTAEQLEARRELQEKIRTRKTLAAVQAAQAEAAAAVAKEETPEKAAAKEEKKIALEELDEKLEELLGKEMMK